MKIGKITYNGTASDSFGLIVAGAGSFDAAEPDMTAYSVPGRNGDIIRDFGRYQNIEIAYPAFIVHDFAENIRDFANALLEPVDYVRIEDTYHPDEYRMGILAAGMSVDPVAWLAAGRFEIVFNCRPERFLKNGETAVEYTTSGSITNPTRMAAKPLIRVYGSGNININGTPIIIASHSLSYIDIDCDLQEAFCGNVNANMYISLDEFPKLDSGANSVVLGGVTSIKLTPRWWQL